MCASQVFLLLGTTCISTLHPSGATGFLLYSWPPFNTSKLDLLGLTLETHSILSWCSACRRMQHHNFIGNLSSIPHNTDTKWSLKTCIAFSAIFLLWSWGGTNWYSILFSRFFPWILQSIRCPTCAYVAWILLLSANRQVLGTLVSFHLKSCCTLVRPKMNLSLIRSKSWHIASLCTIWSENVLLGQYTSFGRDLHVSRKFCGRSCWTMF